jgi:hypothetical protein
MEYLCNTYVVIDKNIILNIENICYDKFKEKWYNDLMLKDHSKLRTYRLFKNENGKENQDKYFLESHLLIYKINIQNKTHI